MESVQSYKLKFIGDKSFVGKLKEYASENPELLKIKSENYDEDPTRLGFDLESVAAVITIIQGAFYIGELAPKILKWMFNDNNKKNDANKVIIQTPTQTIEIRKEGMTEDDVRKILKTAQTIL